MTIRMAALFAVLALSPAQEPTPTPSPSATRARQKFVKFASEDLGTRFGIAAFVVDQVRKVVTVSLQRNDRTVYGTYTLDETKAPIERVERLTIDGKTFTMIWHDGSSLPEGPPERCPPSCERNLWMLLKDDVEQAQLLLHIDSIPGKSRWQVLPPADENTVQRIGARNAQAIGTPNSTVPGLIPAILDGVGIEYETNGRQPGPNAIAPSDDQSEGECPNGPNAPPCPDRITNLGWSAHILYQRACELATIDVHRRCANDTMNRECWKCCRIAPDCDRACILPIPSGTLLCFAFRYGTRCGV